MNIVNVLPRVKIIILRSRFLYYNPKIYGIFVGFWTGLRITDPFYFSEKTDMKIFLSLSFKNIY